MRKIAITGHRGAAGLEPENTLRSFRRACQLGVDYVETDVHLSADGEVVCIHDPTVERTTEGTGRVAEMSLTALRELDAGQGERIPTLEETLESVRGRAVLQIELKGEGTVGPTLERLERMGVAPEEVLLISFSLERLAEAYARRPDLKSAALFSALEGDFIRAAIAAGAGGVSAYYPAITAGRVAAIQEAGLEAHAWTIDDPAAMERVARMGVDAITTNRPDLAAVCLSGVA